MEPEQLHNKTVSLLAWYEVPGQDSQVMRYTGVIILRAGKLYFEQAEKSVSFEIIPEWIDRLKPVTDDVKHILPSELVLSLSLGDLPSDSDSSGMELTGLKWPSDDLGAG